MSPSSLNLTVRHLGKGTLLFLCISETDPPKKDAVVGSCRWWPLFAFGETSFSKVGFSPIPKRHWCTLFIWGTDPVDLHLYQVRGWRQKGATSAWTRRTKGFLWLSRVGMPDGAHGETGDVSWFTHPVSGPLPPVPGSGERVRRKGGGSVSSGRVEGHRLFGSQRFSFGRTPKGARGWARGFRVQRPQPLGGRVDEKWQEGRGAWSRGKWGVGEGFDAPGSRSFRNRKVGRQWHRYFSEGPSVGNVGAPTATFSKAQPPARRRQGRGKVTWTSESPRPPSADPLIPPPPPPRSPTRPRPRPPPPPLLPPAPTLARSDLVLGPNWRSASVLGGGGEGEGAHSAASPASPYPPRVGQTRSGARGSRVRREGRPAVTRGSRCSRRRTAHVGPAAPSPLAGPPTPPDPWTPVVEPTSPSPPPPPWRLNDPGGWEWESLSSLAFRVEAPCLHKLRRRWVNTEAQVSMDEVWEGLDDPHTDSGQNLVTTRQTGVGTCPS